jgi:hypothetical protein
MVTDERQQIRELESTLAAARPKSKFAFSKPKPKQSDAVTAHQASAPSSASHNIQAYGEDVILSTATTAPTSAIKFENRKDEHLTLEPSLNGSSSLILTNLEGCILDFRLPKLSASPTTSNSRLTSIHAQGLKRCLVLADVEGSIMLLGVESSVLVVSAHQVCSSFLHVHSSLERIRWVFTDAQFRIHQSHHTTVLLTISSQPIIEHCSSILFGAYPEPNIGTRPQEEVRLMLPDSASN